ncbi:MAG TPA: hypothetical protein VLT88_08785 [Desulfosarcina sp.]|nr:hypothetical protein [Desulfosarcina sp.]
MKESIPPGADEKRHLRMALDESARQSIPPDAQAGRDARPAQPSHSADGPMRCIGVRSCKQYFQGVKKANTAFSAAAGESVKKIHDNEWIQSGRAWLGFCWSSIGMPARRLAEAGTTA